MALPAAARREPSFTLRVPTADDAAAWFELFNDPAVMRYVSGGTVQSLEWYGDFVARQQRFASELGVCLFAIVVADDPVVLQNGDDVSVGEVAGDVVAGFVGMQPWSRPWGPIGRIEIGWRLGRAFHGRGLATAGAREALARGVAAGVDNPVALIDVDNAPSIGVARKLGMTQLDLFDSPDGARVGMWGFAEH